MVSVREAVGQSHPAQAKSGLLWAVGLSRRTDGRVNTKMNLVPSEANANDNGGQYEIADSSQECPEYGLRRGLVDRGYGGNVLACIGPLPAHYPFNDAETSLVSGARVHITEFCCRHRLSTERSPLIDAD